MNAVLAVGNAVPLVTLCVALGVPRATVYRRREPQEPRPPRPTPPRALDVEAKQGIVDTLCEPRFVDRSPAEVFHTLLDEEKYIGSERTMYRVLAERDEVKERRNQRVHPPYARPELVATAPNEVWSWDITKLRTTVKWSYCFLYVLLDIFSRYAVGWMIARQESAALAKQLVAETYDKHEVRPGHLVLHADRGAAMTSKALAQLLADLDMSRSFSRPHVSNDNPFSESHFKTAKYHPSYPGKFVVVDDAVAWARDFFSWYNNQHKHSGIAFLTPADVHFGRADEVLARRHRVLLDAYGAHPERFPHGPPRRLVLPPAVYINPPSTTAASASGSAEQTPSGGPRPATVEPGLLPSSCLVHRVQAPAHATFQTASSSCAPRRIAGPDAKLLGALAGPVVQPNGGAPTTPEEVLQ